MAVATDRISRREGVKDGRPTVRDSKVSVLRVLDFVREGGLSPEQVADEFHDVPSAAAVRDALAWADDNPEAVARLRQRVSARERLRAVAIEH